MAEKKLGPNGENEPEQKPTFALANPMPVDDGWREGTRQIAPRESRRGGSEATAHTTGLLVFNVASSRDSDQVARDLGLDPSQTYNFRYFTNAKLGSLGLRPVLDSGPGIVAITRMKKGPSVRYSCHVAGAYLDEPSLRPVTKSKCPVKVEKYRDGLPILVVQLRTGREANTRSRNPGGDAQPSS